MRQGRSHPHVPPLPLTELKEGGDSLHHSERKCRLMYSMKQLTNILKHLLVSAIACGEEHERCCLQPHRWSLIYETIYSDLMHVWRKPGQRPWIKKRLFYVANQIYSKESFLPVIQTLLCFPTCMFVIFHSFGIGEAVKTPSLFLKSSRPEIQRTFCTVMVRCSRPFFHVTHFSVHQLQRNFEDRWSWKHYVIKLILLHQHCCVYPDICYIQFLEAGLLSCISQTSASILWITCFVSINATGWLQ